MGASESSASSYGTRRDEEEEPHQENNRSMGTVTAIATAAAGVAVAAWGISRMLSENTDTQERNRQVTEPSLLNSHGIIYEGLGHEPPTIWSPPTLGRYKINTDGSYRPKQGPTIGYGGILRNHRGKWVRGFIGSIGGSDSLESSIGCLEAECCGILKGLKLLDRLKIEGAILETDSKAAHEWVKDDELRKKSSTNEKLWSTIKDCRKLKNDTNTYIIFVPGKHANQCADKLADMAIKRGFADNLAEGEELYEELDFKDLPREIKKLVEEDAKVCS